MEAPPKLSLSSDQFQNCSRALEFFNKKLQNHQLIETEFDYLLFMISDVQKGKKFAGFELVDSTRVVLNSCKESMDSKCGRNGRIGKVVKCDDYFQEEDGPRNFGNISVTTKLLVKTESSLVLRLLEVTKTESEEPPLSVLHIQHPDWPDHSVPEDTLAVREIFKRTYSVSLSPGVGPIVLHCSAGIGRTGTYCVIHDTVQRILARDMTALDVVNILAVHRSQREEMVKNLEQYYFCYEAVVDALEELISGYNPETRLSSSASNGEDVERQGVREASDETPHQDKRPRVH